MMLTNIFISINGGATPFLRSGALLNVVKCVCIHVQLVIFSDNEIGFPL